MRGEGADNEAIERALALAVSNVSSHVSFIILYWTKIPR